MLVAPLSRVVGKAPVIFDQTEPPVTVPITGPAWEESDPLIRPVLLHGISVDRVEGDIRIHDKVGCLPEHESNPDCRFRIFRFFFSIRIPQSSIRNSAGPDLPYFLDPRLPAD
jgi:hypothetical protein